MNDSSTDFFHEMEIEIAPAVVAAAALSGQSQFLTWPAARGNLDAQSMFAPFAVNEDLDGLAMP